MNLQFDSIGELEEFLAFAGFAKEQNAIGEMAQACAGTNCGSFTGNHSPECHAEYLAAIDGTGEAVIVSQETTTPGEVHAASAPHEGVSATPATTTRKRRTKAEIVADTAALTAAGATGAGPFDTTQQPINAEHASVNTVQNAPIADITPGARAPVDDADVKLYIAERIGSLGVVDPVKHLNVCRGFISQHQMAPYLRSMQLVDGPGEVAAYDDNHRAQHIAAMECINRSIGGKPLAHEVETVAE